MESISQSISFLGAAWEIVRFFWWIIFPVAFFYVFKFLWMDFVVDKSKFSWLNGLSWTVLEVIPPREIEKGPKLIEPLYWSISGVFVTLNTFDVYLKGALTHRFSLELVGEEGNVHFYIRTQKQFRNLVEAQIYAQYPDAEVLEVPDYVQKFPKVIPNKNWDLWGADLEFVMPDAYPIKTYDKFEEDVTGRMIDPVGGLTEVMGTLTPGQHIWLQYIIEPLSETWKNEEIKLIQKLAGRGVAEDKNAFGHIADVLANLPKGLFAPVEFPGSPKADPTPLEFRLTPGEKEILKAVEENLGFNHFRTKIRLLYLGRRENFDKSYVSSFFGAFKQFNDLNLNNFKPGDKSKTYANYVFKEKRNSIRKRLIFRRYKSRSMDGSTITLSVRELATLFHFPDMDVRTPAVPRIDSKRGTAPVNLPIN